MNFIKNDRLGNFIKGIMHDPFPMENQRCFGPREDGFTEDFLTIEMAKCFYIGEDAYRSDPIPRRLTCTSSFDINKIIWECKDLERRILDDSDNIHNHSVLHIRGVGRGLSLLLLTEIKQWDRIICQDDDHRYSFTLKFFPSFFFYSNIPLTITIGDNPYDFISKRLCE